MKDPGSTDVLVSWVDGLLVYIHQVLCVQEVVKTRTNLLCVVEISRR